MARNDSPDNEFDPEMEGILREHFQSEASDLRSPSDPWVWLESHMEEPDPPSFFSRLLGGLNPLRELRLSPAFAGAGVAVIAVAIAATVWVVSSNGGPETSGGLAAVAPTEAPAATVLRTDPTAAAAESLAMEQDSSIPQQADPTPAEDGRAGEQTGAGSQAVPVPSPVAATDQGRSQVPVPTPFPAAAPPVSTMPSPTPAPQPTAATEMQMPEEEAMEDGASDSQRPAAATPAPYATPAMAPQATMAPAMEAMRGPSGPAGSAGQAGSAGPAGAATAPPAPQPPTTAGGGGTPPATTFKDYQRQQFVSTAEDNVSTFSLDTDRTSFQLALNWARAGYAVDPDSVRAEEWLNAFDYDYDLPSDSSRFAVTSSLYPHPLDEDKRLARIAFQAPELVVDRPLNVTLVLDASGSMGDGNRVDIARQAAESIRHSLRPNDRIAVVHFTGQVLHQYTVEHTHPNDDRVVSSIAWLQPHGSTNVQAGLNLGVRMADEVRDLRPDAYNYVILMSDGVANVDASDPFAILETAYDPNASNPLRLITIGVGINNYNDKLLELLAQHGNGWYRYLDSPEQAQATFARDNWLALSTPFADQTRAQVTWSTETVERWRIIGYENRVTADENFAQDRKEFAEIYSGATTTVLYELELTETALSRSDVGLGRVELRWVDPATGDSRSQSASLSGSPSADFVGNEGALAHFGAIVALAADTYGLLPSAGGEVSADVHHALSALQLQLESLGGQLGTLDAYRDFSFLLDHMTAGVEERLPPSTPSGYSR